MEASAGLGSAPVFLARGGQPHRRAPRQGERHGKNETATTRLETTRGRPPIGGRPHSPAISKCRTGEPASSVDAHAVVLMVACRPPRGGSGTHPGCPHPVTGCRSGTFLTGRQRTQLHCDASHSLLRSHRPPSSLPDLPSNRLGPAAAKNAGGERCRPGQSPVRHAAASCRRHGIRTSSAVRGGVDRARSAIFPRGGRTFDGDSAGPLTIPANSASSHSSSSQTNAQNCASTAPALSSVPVSTPGTIPLSPPRTYSINHDGSVFAGVDSL